MSLLASQAAKIRLLGAFEHVHAGIVSEAMRRHTSTSSVAVSSDLEKDLTNLKSYLTVEKACRNKLVELSSLGSSKVDLQGLVLDALSFLQRELAQRHTTIKVEYNDRAVFAQTPAFPARALLIFALSYVGTMSDQDDQVGVTFEANEDEVLLKISYKLQRDRRSCNSRSLYLNRIEEFSGAANATPSWRLAGSSKNARDSLTISFPPALSNTHERGKSGQRCLSGRDPSRSPLKLAS